ncbi:interleukin-21 receptor-like, partial [Sceloporus undulatus]|uniref:interleukin-21 receptor-like n=1 Tax=Sceloporus undulatus TaxID=8520 RepID=UPI001C4B1482
MPLLLPLLLLFLQQTSPCEELTCFADYLQMLMCTWGWSLRPSRDTSYNLTAKWNCGAGGTCHLLPSTGNTTAAQFTCLAEQKLCFGENTFDVTATTSAGNGPPGVPKGCLKTFLFKENIKPQPPFNLTAHASPSGYNISWKNPYQHWRFHPLNGQLHYELRYRRRGHAWQDKNRKHLLQDTGTFWLLPREFEGPSTEYEVQVRARPRSPYKGAWSMWSSPASLTTLPKTSNHQGDEGGVSWWLVVLGLFPALLAFLSQRLWKKLDLFVPSPVPFFQPLYVGHKGDFK